MFLYHMCAWCPWWVGDAEKESLKLELQMV